MRGLEQAIASLRAAMRKAGIEEITVKALPRADEGLLPVRKPPSKADLIVDVLREWGKPATVKEIAEELIQRGAFLDGADPYDLISPSVTRAENAVRPLLNTTLKRKGLVRRAGKRKAPRRSAVLWEATEAPPSNG